MRRLRHVFAFLLLPALLTAAAGETGRPVVRSYVPRDYEAHNQVFAVNEAPNGLIYFAVFGAVLEFDGRAWRKIVVPTSWIRAVVPAPDGSVYVGATDELGVCRPDATGLMAYTSLMHLLPERLRKPGPIWSAVWHEDALWFAASNFVGRLRGEKIEVWEFPARPRATLKLVNRQLLLRRVGDAFYRWNGKEFAAVTRDAEVTTPAFVGMAGGATPEEVILATDRGVFFRLRDQIVERWTPEIATLAARFGVRNIVRLRDGAYAIATVSSGILIADAAGRPRERITETGHGLASDVTYDLLEDRGGGLWVTTYAGMSRIELGTGLTIFDQRNGRGPTTVFDMIRWRGVLYAGTTDSLYRVTAATPEEPARLVRIGRQSLWTNKLLVHDGSLLVTDNAGVLRFRDEQTSSLVMSAASSVAELVRSASDPARYFVSTMQGVHTFRFEGENAVHEGAIAGHATETQSLLEEADGTLWLGTTQHGFVRARRRPGSATWQDAELVAFAPGTRGVPTEAGWCRVLRGPEGATLFSTGHGAFVAAPDKESLVPAPAFVAAGQAGRYSHPLLAVGDNTIFAQLGDADALDQLVLGRLWRRGDTWTWQAFPKALTEHAGYLGAYFLHYEAPTESEREGVLWVSGRDALVRVDLAAALTTTQPIPAAQVRLVSQRGVGRWGARAGGSGQPLALSFSREPIEFSFAAPRYDAAAKLTYQTRLRGYDERWSEWSARGEASFTNLAGGPFVFEVRARDADGRVGPVAGFTFAVAPPWHRSDGAIALYALFGVGAVVGFVRWRLGRAEREKARLEKTVAERTAELKVAKDVADEANRAKSVFLANMSHELRTPLNGVIGYAQVLMKDRELTPKNRERVQIVQTSGEHLLRMINEVLDFSKIEAGKMELRTAPFHLPQLLRDIAAAISARIEQKQLEFIVDLAPGLPDLVLGDPLKLRQVIDNLLSNAVKFTKQGAIVFKVDLGDTATETVRFAISDTGVGISESDRAKLFQPFQQAADGRPAEPGTGLGLAISQRMVEIMGGVLAVESEPGRGSAFSFAVRLPVIAADAAADRQSAVRIMGYRGRRRRVLVVDDVPTNRHVLRDLLSPLGFLVTEAASGVEALAVAPGLQPDVVLLDLRMPGIDGFELARRLRERTNEAATDALRSDMKLIAMSASVLSFSREDAFTAGCDDFLPKPFREDDLIARLGMALQLEWVGETPASRSSDSRSPFEPVENTLGDAVFAELLACARRGEITQLRRLLADHRGDPLVEKLELLARNYRMEVIREVLERHASTRPPSS